MAARRTVVVTGGAGFIGSHLVDALLADPTTHVTVLDRLSTGGDRANLAAHDGDDRLRFVLGDVTDADAVRAVVADADAVIHAAAEAHVDRSIEDPSAFLITNVIGTQRVLDACRERGVRMLMVSTDEVYGAHADLVGRFDESSPLRPRSPYAASKAAADLLCSAYRTTFGVDVVTVRGTNAYGPRQIERVFPTFIAAALRGESLPVYGEGRQVREYLHVVDWAAAALAVLDRGVAGEVYNIGSGTEIENRDLAARILDAVGASRDLVAFVADRPGHDFRYGVDDARLRALGWTPTISFDEGLASTVAWYRDNLAAVLARTPHPAR